MRHGVLRFRYPEDLGGWPRLVYLELLLNTLVLIHSQDLNVISICLIGADTHQNALIIIVLSLGEAQGENRHISLVVVDLPLVRIVSLAIYFLNLSIRCLIFQLLMIMSIVFYHIFDFWLRILIICLLNYF